MINPSAKLEINKKNLIYNYKSLNQLTSKCISGATIKANAYGLGDIQIYKFLYKFGCRHFFVATIQEAIKIRKKNIYGNIYILNGISKNEINLIKKYKIIPIINSINELKIFQNKSNLNIKIGIHIDTGINRLGIKIDELKSINFKKLNIYIILSHLSSADEKDNKYNKFQNMNFLYSHNFFNSVKIKSLANSMGIILGKEFHYNMIRPGISLYGGYSSNKMKKIIKPVIKLKAKVIQIKTIKKGEFVGYNQTFKAKKTLTIAILGIGYADGISRILSNRGTVFYKKKKFKILGRISMDSITINITNYKKNIKLGNYMDLINYNYDIEKIAKDCSTISNEILTSISNRVERIYI